MFSAFKKFGKLGALASSVARAWSPLALWPDGIDSPGMWIDPSLLSASFNDYTGTTLVATPGTVADASNPVGLALDIRAGAPEVLGPELAPGGGTFDSATGWNAPAEWSISGGVATHSGDINNLVPSTPILTIGKTYQVQVDILAVPTGFQVATGGNYASGLSLGMNTLRMLCTGDTVLRLQANTGKATVLGSVSVREIPGNHMLQATAAARPLESARVNLLTYTDTISGAGWAKRGTASVTVATAPDGTGETATGIGAVTAGDFYQVSVSTASGIRVAPSISLWPISTTGIVAISNANDSANGLWSVDLALLTTGQWNDITRTHPAVTIPTEFTSTSDPYGILVECTSGAPVSFYVKNPQLNFGTVSLAYQSVPGNGSTYTATGFPIYQKYDGVDDGMATASFAAGTLTSGMDCLIAVRRDSAADMICGLYKTDYSAFFGAAESGSSAGANANSGSASVFVDGTQLTGGTAVTRGTLHTALTPDAWHILELRGLDLSAWTGAGAGGFGSYLLNGARGDIMLYPSTASTTDKDAARQYLADYYGVTLP